MKILPPSNPEAFSCRNAFPPCRIRLDEAQSGGKHAPGIPKGTLRGGEAAARTAEACVIELEWSGDSLSLSATVPETSFKKALARRPSWWLNDRLELLFSLSNTSKLVQVVLFPSGTAVTNLVEVSHNHLSRDVSRRFSRCELPFEFVSEYDDSGAAFLLRFSLRTAELCALLEEEDVPFLRFNAMRYRAVGGEEVTYWQPPAGGFVDGRGMGFIWKKRPAFCLEGFGWTPWLWGRSTVFAVLKNLSDGAVEASLRTEWTGNAFEEETLTLAPSGSGRLSCGFRIDPMAVLDGEWAFEAGDVRLRFPVGWKRGFLGRFRCGRPLVSESEAGTAPPFLKRASALLAALPELERTPENILRTSRGDEIPLGRSGAVSRLAGILAETFAEREDRLAAAALLVNDPAVFISSGSMEAPETPERILALGGGMCRASSVLTAAIVSSLPGEEPACLIHVASPGGGSGLPSHYFTGARKAGRVIPLDGELGRFFLNASGRLASLDELTSDPGLAEGSGRGLSPWFAEAADTLSLRTGPAGW